MNCKECGGRMHECHPVVQGTPGGCYANGNKPAGSKLDIHRPGDWFFCLFCDIYVPINVAS